MSLYKVDQLMAEARRLAREYRAATGKPLAGISGEIAIHDAVRLLHLEPAPAGSAGFDAVGTGERAGRRYQIKARAIFDEEKSGQRIGQLKIDQEWDSVLLILLDENYEPYEIHAAGRADVIEAAQKADSGKRGKRGAMSVAKFKIIGRLVWSRENGEEDEVWDNRAGA